MFETITKMNPIGVVSEFIESLISAKNSNVKYMVECDVNTQKLIASSNSNDIANKVNDRRWQL